MAWQMNDFKCFVANINNVAMLNRPRMGAGLYFVFLGAEPLVRKSSEITIRYEFDFRGTEEQVLITAAQSLKFILVDEYVLEFMAAATVINMYVAGDNLERFIQHFSQVKLQARNAETSID